jgi:hypothetical protein
MWHLNTGLVIVDPVGALDDLAHVDLDLDGGDLALVVVGREQRRPVLDHRGGFARRLAAARRGELGRGPFAALPASHRDQGYATTSVGCGGAFAQTGEVQVVPP